MLDGLGGCRGNHQGLSYVPEIIRIELTSYFSIEKSSMTRCQERTCSRYQTSDRSGCTILPIDLDGVSYDLILVLVNRLKKMLRDEPVQILIDVPRLPDSIVSD